MDNPDSDPKEPVTLTIPKSADVMPGDSKSIATGDEIYLCCKVAANDDSGLSLEVTSIEREDEHGKEDKSGEEPEEVEAGGSSSAMGGESSDKATDYVRQQRSMARSGY